MASEITLPGGKKANKWVVIGITAGGGVAAYMVYKNHKKSVASSSTAAGMVTDPSSGVSYPANGTDPVTGETYSQEIGQYGSVEAADSAVSQNAQSYLTNSGDLYGTGYPTSDYNTGAYGGGTTVSGSIYTSNSAWAQAATAGLEDIGYPGTQVAQALGLYLTGSPVTSDEAAIIQAALAEYGNPPVGSFQVIRQPNKPPVTTPKPKPKPKPVPKPVPKPTAQTVTVPNVIGLEADQAGPNLASVGLHSILSGPRFKAGGPMVRIITAQSPHAGSKADKGSTVKLTYKVQRNSLVPKGR